MKIQRFIILLGILLLPFCEKGFAGISDFENSGEKQTGYRAIINFGDAFFVAGTDGRIDLISASGKIIKSEKFPGEEFNCLTSFDKTIVVAGAKGSILISSGNGAFKKVNSGTSEDINSATFFKGKIIAGTNQGIILTGDEKGSFRKKQLSVKGNIVSVSSNSSDCFGVTDEGEIIHTRDGFNWDILDFNQVYSGYYKPCTFTKVLVTENQIAVAGKHSDGTPALLFSTQGNVWTERTLDYTDDQGEVYSMEEIPNDLFYDESYNQFILACDRGKLMTIPSCSHCNKLYTISTDDIMAISGNGKILMVACGNYFFKAVNADL